MNFLGHTRFSVDSYNSKNFAATRQSMDKQDYLDWLYDPERLKPRLEVFCEESLPQIALGSQHHDVRHIVSYSPTLPEYAQTALKLAAKKYSFVRLNETEKQVGAYLPSVDSALSALDWKVGTRLRFGLYRLDDDDLLPSDYFDRMTPYIDAGQAGWRVSFANGFTALRSRGEYYFVRENYQAMASVGLLTIAELSESGDIEGAKDYSHTKTDRYQPVILDSREPGFFRSRHRTQDNAIGVHTTPYPVETFQQLRRYPEGDLKSVRNSFPILQDKVYTDPEAPTSKIAIFHEPVVVTQAPIPFFLPFKAGATLHIRVSEGERIVQNSLMVSLRLRDSDGHPIDTGKMKSRLAQVNIRYSAEYGFYTPVWHGEIGRDYHCLLKLPDGLELLGAELVAGKKGPIHIDFLGAFPLPSDDASRASRCSNQ